MGIISKYQDFETHCRAVGSCIPHSSRERSCIFSEHLQPKSMVFLYSKSFRRNRSEESQDDGAVGKNIIERFTTQNSPSHNPPTFSYQPPCHLSPRLQYIKYLLVHGVRARDFV